MSGGLAGVIRNETGVIEYPDGTWPAAAVFTQADGGSEPGINAAIGQTAAHSIGETRRQPGGPKNDHGVAE